MTIRHITTSHSGRSLLSLIKLYHSNYLYLTVRIKKSVLPLLSILQTHDFIYSFSIVPTIGLSRKLSKITYLIVSINFKTWHNLNALHIIDIFPRQVAPMRHKLIRNWFRRQRNKSARLLLINTSKGILTHTDAIRQQLGGFPIAILT